MKVFVVIGLIISLALLGFYAYQQRQAGQLPGHPVPTLSPTQLTYCDPANLQALVTLEPGAGNVYGMLTIKNLSDKTCQIMGSNFIKPVYDIVNVALRTQGESGPEKLPLGPGQTVYSRVHYPNGPQCSSNIVTKHIAFTYQTSPDTTITFTDQRAKAEQEIVVCQAMDELTEVEVWSLSDKSLQ